MAAGAGADAIGLNFYEKSARCVSMSNAREISNALVRYQLGAISVGVFVNHSSDQVKSTWVETKLSAVQLHGDEPPEFLASLKPIPAIRVRRFDNGCIAAIVRDLTECRMAGSMPFSVLVDALSPGRYGGTGETISWAGLADHAQWLKLPLILAGGLTPDNVAEAIRIVRPDAVDVASGVEFAPGKKDAAKIRDFVAAAQAAFRDL